MDETQRQPADPSRANPARLRCVHYLRGIRLEEGGVVRAVLDICSGLAALGHAVTLVTSDSTDVPAEWKSEAPGSPRAMTVPVPPMRGAVSGELESTIANADVLHLHTPWEPANLSLARTAEKHHVPYIVSIHGMLDAWSVRQKWLKKRIFLALAGNRFLRGAARIHCTAQAELEQASRFLRPGSGAVVPLPIDLSAYARLPGPELAKAQFPRLTGESPRLLFLSRLHPKKRPELLIEAAARLVASGQPLQVVLAGPGDPAYVSALQQLVRDRGLQDHVLFAGMVRGELKVSLYQSADAFVLPTSQENFGYVLIEALAAGTPVITTRGVDIWEELQRIGAIIVEPEAGALAQAIQSLVRDLPEARKTGQRGREWVFREVSRDTVMARYDAMYREVTPGLKKRSITEGTEHTESTESTENQ